VERFIQDIRYALRLMVSRPGFTLIAVVALALGIGANTAVFSVVNGVLLRPLNYRDPDRLVRLWQKTNTWDQGSASYLNFRDWRDKNNSFEKMAAFRSQDYTLTGGEFPEQVSGRQASADLFSLLGVAPFIGRDFTAGEDQPGAQLSTILTYKFWMSRFGGDATIVGKSITLNGNTYNVIGVLPASFHLIDSADLYTGIHNIVSPSTESRAISPGIRVVGRLKAGVSLEQARSDMIGVAADLARQYPESNEGMSVTIKYLRDSMVGDAGQLLLVLSLAVSLVLLIACANVASLLLASSAARWKEIAIRTALGAGRVRIVRQLLTESVLLAIAGGGLGLLLAWAGTGAALKSIPDVIPRSEDVGVDKWVLGFTLLASAVTGVLFGLAPALQASRPNMNEAMKEGSRGSTGARHRVLSFFVVGEIAIAVVLLAGAGLLLRTFVGLQAVNPGFEAKNLLTFNVAAQSKDYREPGKMKRFFRDVAEGVRAIPGVRAAGLTALLPLSGGDSEMQFYRNDKPRPPVSELPSAMNYVSSPGFAEAMHIPLMKGRYVNDQDGHNAPPVTMIDTNLERLYFPGEDPIGKHITLGAGADLSFDMEIVGVVGHIKQENLDTDGGSSILPQNYLLIDQIPDKFFSDDIGGLTVVARTGSDPMGYVSAIKQKVRDIDRNVPVYSFRSMEEVVRSSVADRRFVLILIGAFAVLALVLASVGIYGVMAYSVSQRTHEIGIRMALGAAGSSVLGMVLGNGLKLALLGVGIGLAGAAVGSRVLSGMLYHVSSYDPLTLTAVAIVLTLIAALASFIPARRATRVDPIVALRYE
jgi:predicted permease